MRYRRSAPLRGTTWTPRRMRLVGAALLLTSLAVLYTLARLAASLLTSSAAATASATESVVSADDLEKSVLHANAAKLPPLAPGKRIDVHRDYGLDAGTFTTTTTFALHGNHEQRGIHFRLRNAGVVHEPRFLERDATLIVVIFTDRISWGPGRNVDALFALLAQSTIERASVSLTLLTTNMDEFHAVRERLYDYISDYAQISLLFRNDFKAATSSRAARFSMLARYRNFALHSTLHEWHQHVVWLDPDVYAMPRELLTTLIRADGDIVAPLLIKAANVADADAHGQFDDRAWRADLRQWRNFRSEEKCVKHQLSELRQRDDTGGRASEWTPLDSVGIKLLYVRADVHRQGVAFPFVNAIQDRHAGDDDADGIEAGGLCYAAHFVGYKCWGMASEKVYHHYTDIERWLG